jgi:hypothetical protein
VGGAGERVFDADEVCGVRDNFARTAFMVALVSLQTVPVSAEPVNRWWSGWGMGVSEYGWSGSDGSTIYMTCENRTEVGLRVAIRDIDPKPKSEIVFALNGQKISFWTKPNGEIETQSRVSMNNVYFLFDELKNGSNMTLSFNGLSKRFNLAGSSKGLGSEFCA